MSVNGLGQVVIVYGVPITTLYCAVSVALTGAVCWYAKPFGQALRLVDKPDGNRKLHEKATPLVGGLAVLVPSFAVSTVYLLTTIHAHFMIVALAAAAITLVIGLIDDRTGLSPVWRLLAMMYIIFTAFSLEPLFVLHTLRSDLFGLHLSISLDPVAAPITVLFIVGFANAANMADGMNGQLLGSVVIWSLFIARHLGAENALPFIAISCSALVAIVFNLRGRLFSGSSGAYAVSLFIALGAIAAYRRAHGSIPAEMAIYWFWLPVLDCLRLVVARLKEGRSPFSGDRNHFHHVLHDHLRMRHALIVYLVLLAAPGAAEEIGPRLGSVALMICVSIYGAIILVPYARGFLARSSQQTIYRPMFIKSTISTLVPSYRHSPVTAPNRKAAAAPQSGSAHIG
jgi:UDP-GlcNAc:undecaprenyl-phosphate GlcNAc-1-phosphate transferase